MRNRSIGAAVLVALNLCGCDEGTAGKPAAPTTPPAAVPSATDATGDGMLPAGKYVGSVSSLTTTTSMQYRYSPIIGGGMQMVPQITPVLFPSPFGDLILDGRGNYSLTALKDSPENPSGGTYTLDAKAPAVVFVSGPLKQFKTSLAFSVDGTPSLNARTMIPAKDPKPGELLEKEFVVDFRGTTPNPKFATRTNEQPKPAVAIGETPAAPKIAPPDWKDYTGTLLLCGKTTLRLNLSDGSVDTSLPNVMTDANPSSPAGPIVLTIYRGNEVLIQVVDAKGTEQGAPIRVQSMDALSPPDPTAAISPDGKLIAYYVNYSAIRKNEFLMDIYSEVQVCDLAGKIVATHKGYAQPTWTPDGKLVLTGAMALPGGPYLPASQTGIFIADPITAAPKQIMAGLEPPAFPAISPDGRRMCFIESRALWTANIDGTSRKKVLTIGNNGYLYDAAWSPNGKGLAVCHAVNSFESRVDILDLESDKLLRVFDPKNQVSVAGTRVVWLP